jgi:3-deoxy-D-manno-octulosonic-acid transferase
MGPHTFNFAAAAEDAIAAGAAERIADLGAALARVARWLAPGHGEELARRAQAAQRFAAAHRGAAARLAAQLLSMAR